MNTTNMTYNGTTPSVTLIYDFLFLCLYDNETHSTVRSSIYSEDLWCPRLFDGYSCWNETPAGATPSQNCPSNITGYDPNLLVYKRCMEDGTWFIYPEKNENWTDYTSCIDREELAFKNLISGIYVVGYAISTVALIISLGIFGYFRTLRCSRIRIHMHLFSSFSLNNLHWILWYTTVVNNASVVENNELWCQVLHVLTNYFMMASYFWMFCEGLHLHFVLVVVFVKDLVTLRWFAIFAWGLPIVLASVYAAARYRTGAIKRCWIDENDAIMIVNLPVFCSLVISFIFVTNVLKVLVEKIRSLPNHHRTMAATRKAARATVVLIPLLGLQYMLIPLRPTPATPDSKEYQIISAILTSFQGLWVSVIYCFTNHEVMAIIKTHWSRYRMTREAYPLTGVTGGGESVIIARDNAV